MVPPSGGVGLLGTARKKKLIALCPMFCGHLLVEQTVTVKYVSSSRLIGGCASRAETPVPLTIISKLSGGQHSHVAT